jgi:hypothetical protein
VTAFGAIEPSGRDTRNAWCCLQLRLGFDREEPLSCLRVGEALAASQSFFSM